MIDGASVYSSGDVQGILTSQLQKTQGDVCKMSKGVLIR